MKLEAVITCSSYSDFLSHSLPLNKGLFDKLVVVTSPEDTATRKLCEYHHVECVVTDAFDTKNGSFCKGKGINAGLARLDKDGWCVQLDADIVLPPLFRVILEKLDLDNYMIYGCDRMMVPDYDAWAKFMTSPKVINENETWTHLDAFPLGVRVSHGHQYVSIGFLQLWHPSASGIDTYPDQHTTAARGDMVFSEKWPRSKRGFLPELVVFHLESEKAPMSVNWGGRATAPFGPADMTVVAPRSKESAKPSTPAVVSVRDLPISYVEAEV